MSQIDLFILMASIWVIVTVVLISKKNGVLKSIGIGFVAACAMVFVSAFSIGLISGMTGKGEPQIVKDNQTHEDADSGVEQKLDQMIEDAPQFVHHDEQEYGYQTENGAVIMIRYLGEYAGVYQFMVRDTADSFFIYSIEPPYKFVKAMTFFGRNRELIKKETFAAENTVVQAALHDAKRGKLAKHLNRDKKTMWVNDQSRVEFR